jgi:signal peptidase II
MNSYLRQRAILFTALTTFCLALDLWSKSVAFTVYGLRNGSAWLFDTGVRFRWFTSLNEGALWGMGQGFAWVFALLSVAAFGGIVFWLFSKKAAESLWLTVSLSFVSGGTLGNLYDRLGLHGIIVPGGVEPIKAVRDFFHFQFGGTPQNPGLDWAIFNIADICLVTGAIMLMLQSLLAPEPLPVAAKSEPTSSL